MVFLEQARYKSVLDIMKDLDYWLEVNRQV